MLAIGHLIPLAARQVFFLEVVARLRRSVALRTGEHLLQPLVSSRIALGLPLGVAGSLRPLLHSKQQNMPKRPRGLDAPARVAASMAPGRRNLTHYSPIARCGFRVILC